MTKTANSHSFQKNDSRGEHRPSIGSQYHRCGSSKVMHASNYNGEVEEAKTKLVWKMAPALTPTLDPSAMKIIGRCTKNASYQHFDFNKQEPDGEDPCDPRPSGWEEGIMTGVLDWLCMTLFCARPQGF